ncbi:MAG: septum formation initiator family protein [Spirochaetia bacterium]|nr:septum formation initiator family protein [Spirochaetia bacterium]
MAWRSKRVSMGKSSLRQVLLIVVVILGGAVLVRNGFNYFSTKAARDSIKAEIETLKQKNEELSKKAQDIYADKEFVEKTAYEKLNLARQGETVIIITDGK